MTLPAPLSETAGRALRALLTRSTATRPELSDALGVTKQTVSHAVAELEERDLVEAVAVQQGPVGRSALRYALHRGAGWVAGIELGDSRLRVAAARIDGTVVAERVVANPAPTVLRGWPDQLELAAHALAGLAGDLSESEGGLLGAAIAVPRAVPAVRDLIGERLEDADAQLLVALAPVAPAAVWTENDVNCGALAQLAADPDAVPASVLYLHVGVGLGAAFILHGRVVRGARGRVGEIRRLPAPVGDAPTAEEALGAEGLLSAAGHSTAAPLVGAIDDLFAAAGLGDAAAEAAVAGEALGLARLIAVLTAVVDPEVVVLAGLIGGRPDLLEPVRAACAELEVPEPVVADPLGEGAVAAGAAALAAERVLDALAG